MLLFGGFYKAMQFRTCIPTNSWPFCWKLKTSADYTEGVSIL